MVDKEPNSSDMIVKFLGERQGFTNKPTCALTQRAVKAFDILSAFPVAVMLTIKDNCLTGQEQVGMTFGF
jgi:hypothetical protein